VRDYYEDLWDRLPRDLAPPAYERRLALLRDELRPGERVLDLGCGEGAFTGEIAAAGASVVGVEVAEAALRRARARLPEIDFRRAPFEGPLPLQDASVDLVWATEVIEHVADTARWLSEVRRVLVPGGRLLLTTPDHPRLALALRGVEPYSEPLGDHLHLYTRRSLRDTLRDAGFEQVTVRRAGGAPLWREMLVGRAVRS
jgi:SAM-dependent methyltransferase